MVESQARVVDGSAAGNCRASVAGVREGGQTVLEHQAPQTVYQAGQAVTIRARSRGTGWCALRFDGDVQNTPGEGLPPGCSCVLMVPGTTYEARVYSEPAAGCTTPPATSVAGLRKYHAVTRRRNGY